jgi:hypothetical protein
VNGELSVISYGHGKTVAPRQAKAAPSRRTPNYDYNLVAVAIIAVVAVSVKFPCFPCFPWFKKSRRRYRRFR